MKKTAKTQGDINIRISRRAHKLLKTRAVRYGITIKELISLLSLTKYPIRASNDSIEQFGKD